MTQSKFVEFKKLDNEASLKIENSKKKNVYVAPVYDEASVNPKHKGYLQDYIQVRDTLNYKIVMMFYYSGLSFYLVRIPYYMSVFSYAINTSNLFIYVSPTYNKLRDLLISKEKSHVENLLQPIRNLWNKKSGTMVSDGWRIPLINFMASGPIFLKSIDESG